MKHSAKSKPVQSSTHPPPREGDRVPDLRFRVREYDEWKEVSSRDLFAGKVSDADTMPRYFTEKNGGAGGQRERETRR